MLNRSESVSTAASKPKIPPRRLYLIHRSYAEDIVIEAHSYTAKGTAAGWLLAFTTVLSAELDGPEVIYSFTRRSFAFPLSCIWEVVEEQVPTMTVVN